jgi:hypothetical protein
MSQLIEKVIFTYNGNNICLTDLKQLCDEVIKEKLNRGSSDKYVYLLQVVQANDLQYDSLKLFSRIVSSLLKAETSELIDLILSKPPPPTVGDESEYTKSFTAYQEFCLHLLAFNCACVKKVTNYVLIEALKLCTHKVSKDITLKVGGKHTFETIEDIQKKCRHIASSVKKKELTLIQDQDELEFMTELLKTHPNAKEKGITGQEKMLKIYKGRSKQNTPCFYLSHTKDDLSLKYTPSSEHKINGIIDISYMKSINEIAVKLSHTMIHCMRELPSGVKNLLDLVITLIKKFPNSKSQIVSLITKTMPHAMMAAQMHAIYIKIMFYLVEQLPNLEEELLGIVLSRFCQIDVNIKSKQLANKRHFTSDDLKADVYLYYIIKYFKARIHQIDSQVNTQATGFTKDVKMQDDNDDDSILESSDEEDTRDNSTTAQKHKIDNFCDMLIRLFEKNILPFSELHYPQYCFLYVASISQLFLQKMVTLFILKAFSKTAHINVKTHCVNYICSLLATSSQKVISIKIFLDSVRFLVKFFKTKFHSKQSNIERYETISSNSDGSMQTQKKVKMHIKVDDKLFYISVIQGLSYILSFKIPEIGSQDPSLLHKMLKLILNNEFKAVLFNQGSTLKCLLNSFKVNHVDPKYIRRLTKQIKTQKHFLRYKRDLFNRIKRKMPFGTPLFLNESGQFFKDFHSHLPDNQIQESIVSTLIPPERRKSGNSKAELEEEKVTLNSHPKKRLTFEDKEFNSAMISAFGAPKMRSAHDIRKTVFGKLGRSLSVEYMHKHKAGATINTQKTHVKSFLKTLEITQDGGVMQTQMTLEQFENHSDGYTSGKDTDAASIDLLDRSKPWSHIRNSRNVHRRRRHKRVNKSNKNQS